MIYEFGPRPNRYQGCWILSFIASSRDPNGLASSTASSCHAGRPIRGLFPRIITLAVLKGVFILEQLVGQI
jgi:hypothetical protein